MLFTASRNSPAGHLRPLLNRPACYDARLLFMLPDTACWSRLSLWVVQHARWTGTCRRREEMCCCLTREGRVIRLPTFRGIVLVISSCYIFRRKMASRATFGLARDANLEGLSIPHPLSTTPALPSFPSPFPLSSKIHIFMHFLCINRNLMQKGGLPLEPGPTPTVYLRPAVLEAL